MTVRGVAAIGSGLAMGMVAGALAGSLAIGAIVLAVAAAWQGWRRLVRPRSVVQAVPTSPVARGLLILSLVFNLVSLALRAPENLSDVDVVLFVLVGCSLAVLLDQAIDPIRLPPETIRPRPLWAHTGGGTTTLTWIRDQGAPTTMSDWAGRSRDLDLVRGAIWIRGSLAVAAEGTSRGGDGPEPWPQGALPADVCCLRLQEIPDAEMSESTARVGRALLGPATETEQRVQEPAGRPMVRRGEPIGWHLAGESLPAAPIQAVLRGDDIIGLTWPTRALPGSHPLAPVDQAVGLAESTQPSAAS